MSPLPPEVLQELQAEYIATFAEKISQIEKDLLSKKIENLIQHFHKLAGSGASYSMPEISELGRATEGYLKNPNLVWSVVKEAVDCLRQVFKAREKGLAGDITSSGILQKLKR